jgi:2-dehydro-3-deoxy-L-rhamnonate dehydrogenase (NAD+)
MRRSANGLGRVLVTGGASGLGAAVVASVTQAGGTSVILDRQRPASNHVEHHQVDLADARAAEQVVAEVAGAGLDAVVTCAGIDSCGPLADVPGSDWDRVVAVNLLGTAAVVRAALPALLESRGSVVTVASTLGVRALPEATAYCAAKFGVVGLTRSLGAELGDSVRVTCLIPGGMRTPFFDGRPDKYRPGPDASLMDPADVAEAIVGILTMPGAVHPRELVLIPPGEPSWP